MSNLFLKQLLVNFDIKGLNTFDDAIDKVSGKLAQALYSIIEKHWRSDEGIEGEWKDLTPITWANKTTDKMLLETGEMRESLQIISIDREKIVVGYTDPKAVYHEEGNVNLPKRDSVYLNNDDWYRIEKIVIEAITESWEA